MTKSIFFAASWSHIHLVGMLTSFIQGNIPGIEIHSFLTRPVDMSVEPVTGAIPDINVMLEENREIIKRSTLVYISPSGADSWAMVGMAYAYQRPIVCLSPVRPTDEMIGVCANMVQQSFGSFQDLTSWLHSATSGGLIIPESILSIGG